MARDVITGGFTGRAGNQMYQIAAVVALATKHKVEYTFQKPRPESDPHPIYFSHFPQIEIIDSDRQYHNECPHGYQEIPYNGGTLCLCGYYQSEKYFKDYRKQVIDAIGIGWMPLKGLVSIHVRRGDYKEGTPFEPVTMDYISRAVVIMNGKGYFKFTVFSDDILWCIENVNQNTLPGSTFEYSQGRTPLEDLKFMSCHESHIIANSTFSWWAAWLNRNPEKTVISPAYWFNGQNKDLLPDEWIKI